MFLFFSKARILYKKTKYTHYFSTLRLLLNGEASNVVEDYRKTKIEFLKQKILEFDQKAQGKSKEKILKSSELLKHIKDLVDVYVEDNQLKNASLLIDKCISICSKIHGEKVFYVY